jgi:hypothetical protein
MMSNRQLSMRKRTRTLRKPVNNIGVVFRMLIGPHVVCAHRFLSAESLTIAFIVFSIERGLLEVWLMASKHWV